MLVRDLMTTKVFSLLPRQNVHDAKQLMHDKRVRHVPVVSEDGLFLGLVSHRDILAASISKLAGVDAATLEELDLGLTLKELMHTEVLSISPGASVREAAQLMMDNKIGCLPVIEGRELKGIITESDYLKLVVELLDSLDKIN